MNKQQKTEDFGRALDLGFGVLKLFVFLAKSQQEIASNLVEVDGQVFKVTVKKIPSKQESLKVIEDTAQRLMEVVEEE